VERVSFWRFDERDSVLRCEEGFVASLRLFEKGGTLTREEHPAYFDAVRQAHIIDAPDVRSDPRTRDLAGYFESRGVVSLLDVPVWADGRLAGVLCHEQVGARRLWGAWDTDFAAGAGQVVASTLATRGQSQAESLAQRASFLDEFSHAVFRLLDAQSVAQAATSHLVPELGDYAVVHLLNRGGPTLRLVAHSWQPSMTALVERATRLDASGMTLAVRAIAQGQSLFLPEINATILERHGTGVPLRDLLLEGRVSSGMAIPLCVANRTLGALSLYSVGRHHGSDELALAREAADRLAMALENARHVEVAEQAVRARDDFVVLASHELRTPLSSLALLVEHKLRRKARGAPEDPRHDEAIARQVSRLTGLVERMLEAVRVQSEGIPLALELADLEKLVERAVADVSGRRGPSARIELTNDTGAAGTVGLFDPVRIGKALDELLDNAVKFSAGEPVEVILQREGGHALLTVHDRGDGIPPDRVAAIFSPFERAVSKQHFGGLGLGLFVARAIVEAHGGTLEASGRPGGGSTFTLRIPLQRPA
jgi:signal transduction histidine kinase